jgi:hypothetical protein
MERAVFERNAILVDPHPFTELTQLGDGFDLTKCTTIVVNHR